MAARTINIFLASSDELKNDRNSFHSFIATLDDIYESRGIRIKLKRWEDFSAFCTGERTQDEYNKVVRASDMCIAMFHRKAGKFTIEEFHQALDEYKSNKKHPKTYVYARVLIEGETEEQELTDFKKELFEKMGHYWCNYATDDSMKLHFVMQFERYVTPQLELGTNSNMTVENGVVRLYNREIARYENLPFAFNNEQYTRLKEDITREETEIIQLRSIGNDALLAMINEKIKVRDEKRKMLEETERNMFETALYISKLQSDDKPMSERKRRAIELFEQGKNREAAAVLNEDEIAEDARRASDKIAQGKALIEVGNELYEKGMSEILSLIDEYILRAKSLMGDTDNNERLELSCRSYENAIQLADKYLDRIECADLMKDYGQMLLENCQFKLSREWYGKAMNIYMDLFEDHNCKFNDSNLSLTLKLARCGAETGTLLHKLGEYSLADDLFQWPVLLYSQIADFYSLQNSGSLPGYIDETMSRDGFYFIVNYCSLLMDLKEYEKVIEQYKFLKENLERWPYDKESYSQCVARGLGQCYLALNDNSNSEKYLLESLDIARVLVNENPSIQNKENYSGILNDLGGVYHQMFKFDLAEKYCVESCAVLRQLVSFDSMKYSGKLADALNTLSLSYTSLGKLNQAESNLLEALAIYRSLAETDPIAYVGRIAMSLLNYGNALNLLDKFIEAEDALNESLKLYKQLAESNETVYLDKVSRVLLALADLYCSMEENAKAVHFFKEALSIYRKLYDERPDAYIVYMARFNLVLGAVYEKLGDLDSAKKCFCEASNFYRMPNIDDFWKEDLVVSFVRLGEICQKLKDYESAEKAYMEAAQVSENNGGLHLYADILNHLAVLHCGVNQLDLACKEYQKAIEIYIQLIESDYNAYEDMARSLKNLGNVYNKMEDYESAKKIYNESLRIYRELEKYTPGEYLERINSICDKLNEMLK